MADYILNIDLVSSAAMPGAPSSAAAQAALQRQAALQAQQAQQDAAEAEQRRKAEAKALAQQDGEKWWIYMDWYCFRCIWIYMTLMMD